MDTRGAPWTVAAREVRDLEQEGAMVQTSVEPDMQGGSIVGRPQFWFTAALVLLVTTLGYLPDLFYAAGRQIPALAIEFVSRDINLLLIPLPVFYAAHHFRKRGTVVVGVALILLFLPHLAISTAYAQSLLRMVVFTLFVVVLGLLYADALEKRRHAARMYRDLQKSEAKLRDFLENANDMIESVDGEGRFLFVNRAWTEALGYTAEEAAAMHVDDVVHPDYRAKGHEMFARMSRGERLDNLEMAFVAKDGSTVYVEGSVNAELEGDRFVRSRCIFRNVTERRQLMSDLCASDNRYRDLFEHSREALYTTKREGTILDANPAMAELFGYAREEMLGVDVTTLYANPTDRETFKERIERESAVIDYPLELKKKDGSAIRCSITAIAVTDADGHPRGYQGIIRPLEG